MNDSTEFTESQDVQPKVGSRGLLDIKTTLSNPDPMAGSEFTVYVLVTNLFDVPIWPIPPKVFLPSEMRPVSAQRVLEDSVKSLSNLLEHIATGSVSIPTASRSRLGRFFERKRSKTKHIVQALAERILNLEKELQEVEEDIHQIQLEIEQITSGKSWSERLDMIKNDETLRQSSEREADLTRKTEILREEISNLTTQIVTLTDSTVIVANGDLKIENLNPASRLFVQALGDVEISLASPQLVSLESSLEPGTPLQPGNTVVYSLALTTRRTILFRPIQYTLQYSVNYSFEGFTGPQQTNMATQQMTIRAPIISVMSGAILGGLAGSFVRTLLQDPEEIAFSKSFMILLLIAVILSAISVVFLARKSETQALVTVEDFWGGIVIGFLVGYTGVSFFEESVMGKVGL
ncbi:hypothetical protein [Candidatus Leptofilum sp.]|uniref:sulfite exporter TauE/SafE family protein n=1 Tax=Candidatus Leptofilum sp. TaxID=3241576 RepID=UPI003B5C7C83